MEGHGTHRVAAQHRRELVGKAFVADSPNGRFVDGAAAVSGKVLTAAECVGKNLLYTFGTGPGAVTVHIHFGMAGRFSTHRLPGPAPTATTRLRLVHAATSTVALLSAMTVQHGGPELRTAKLAALGPDPLREDADPERLWASLQRTPRSVGLVLMDQACVAGVGNIYRAEILYKAGIHPEMPGNQLTRPQFDRVWHHTVDLMQRGFVTGSILTVDASEKLPAPWTRRYVYNQSSCGRCGGGIRTWSMATRTVYCCDACQPLPSHVGVSQARTEAMAAAGPARLFQSHCAPDGADTLLPSKMSVAQLRAALLAKGAPLPGRPGKAQLVAALQAAHADAQAPTEVAPAAPALAPAPRSVSAPALPAVKLGSIRPGTAHLVMEMASAEEAAQEKAEAGESGAVEHVALADDAADAVRKEAAGKRKAQGVLPFAQRKKGVAGAAKA